MSDVQFEVEFLSGPKDGQVIQVTERVAAVGNSRDALIRIAWDDLVKSEHAQITYQGDAQFEIEDLGTEFGTLVDDEKIDKKVVTSKNILRLGFTEFVCREPDESSGKTAEKKEARVD